MKNRRLKEKKFTYILRLYLLLLLSNLYFINKKGRTNKEYEYISVSIQ